MVLGGADTPGSGPTASEYLRYVSMEATTTRASTVMRSMPTSETRTHASMTMPLSSTRSSTSMRLVPPDARSTGMVALIGFYGLLLRGAGLRLALVVRRGEVYSIPSTKASRLRERDFLHASGCFPAPAGTVQR